MLDSSGALPGPENRKPLPPKLRKVETAAATAAAWIGQAFSTTQNVTIGTATSIDENRIASPAPRHPESPGAAAAPSDKSKPEDMRELVPWVRFK